MKVIIIMGPPGSGKGTQAKLISEKLGFVHFDTGQHFESILYNPEFKNNKEIQRERKIFEAGILLTPSWAAKMIIKRVKELADLKMSIVFSGSPRTIYEAFGDKKTEGLLKTLERYYGKKNINVFKINVPVNASIKRNSSRLICSVCGTPLMANSSKLTAKSLNCPFCGGKLRKRTLDKPEIIKKRLVEYKERTGPVIKGMKKMGYRIVEVDGASAPYKIHEKIFSYIK